MKCLENYILLNACDDTVSDSGLYLEDLPGIELRQINEIANEDQQNYVGVWDSIQKRALKRFETDLRKAFMSKYNLKGIAQSINIGQIVDTNTTKAASSEYRGAAIELNTETQDYVDSNFQVIFIQNIKIYVPGAKTFNLKLYDLDTGTELYTEEITTTAEGWTSININDYFVGSRRIFVAYDCTTIDSVKLDVDKFNLDCIRDCQARLRGANAQTGTPTELTYDTNNLQGLSIVYSIKCKYDVAVCNNKELFSQALLYLLGVELMKEQINSSRTTQWTMLKNKEAKELMSYFRAVYEGGILDEIEYTGELQDAVNLLNFDKSDCCLECSGTVKFVDAYL